MNATYNKIASAFLIILIGILFLPELFMKGMFFDGVTYASIARNLSFDYTSFWSPYYTKVIYPVFYEHPPLVFGLQSVFFKIFGDHFYVEKIYSLIMLMLNGFGIFKLWKLFMPPKSAWIPLFLFTTLPIVIWASRNNMLENTLTVFTTFSVYFYVNAIMKKEHLQVIIATSFVFLSVLSKGPVGLFPIVIPLLYFIVFKNDIKQTVSLTLISIIFLAICFLLLFIIFPESKVNFKNYLETQLFTSLKGEREITTTNRFTLLFLLLKELIIPIVITCISYLTLKRKISFDSVKTAFFFLMIGLSASLPMLISLKQRAFYLVPSLVFFAIGFGIIIFSIIEFKLTKTTKIKMGSLKTLTVIALIISLSFTIYNYGKSVRDHELIASIEENKSIFADNKLIGSRNMHCHDWTIVAYLMRYEKVSLSCADSLEYVLDINFEEGNKLLIEKK